MLVMLAALHAHAQQVQLALQAQKVVPPQLLVYLKPILKAIRFTRLLIASQVLEVMIWIQAEPHCLLDLPVQGLII